MPTSAQTIEEFLGPPPTPAAAAVAAPQQTIEQFLGERAPKADPRAFDEFLGPPPLPELERRFGDLDYTPTDYEIGRYLDLRKEKPLDPWSWPGIAGAAVRGLVETGVKAVGALPQAIQDPRRGVQSVAEGVARGYRNTENLVQDIQDYAWPPEKGPFLDLTPGPRVKLSPTEAREEQIRAFRIKRERDRQTARLERGEETLLPETEGKVIPELVGGVSIVADPINYLPIAGLGGKTAGVIARAGGRTLQGAGLASEVVGKTLGQAVKYPARKGAELLERITEDVPTQGLVKFGAGAAAAAAGLSFPAVSVPLIKVGGAALAAEKLGELARAAGRNIARPSFSEQAGLLRNISRDKAAPAWVRQVAEFARPIDPILSRAGRGVIGGLEGAAIGGTLGGLAGGEEGFASGLGIGGALGSFGGAVRGKDWAQAAQRDLVRWRATLDPERLVALDQAMPNPAHQIGVMNAQRFISGLGDVDFHYFTADQWKAAGMAPGRALETTPGDRPQVYVNVNQIGDGAPVFHEMGHVLHRLYPEQTGDLHRILFSDFHVPGGKGTDFTTGRTDTSRGILSAEQQQKLYDSYFSKLDPETQGERRASWDRGDHVRSAREEIISELLSTLLTGKEPDYLHKLSGPLRRVADSLILNTRRRFLAKITGLDRLGEKIQPGGSSLLTLDGQPLRLTGREAAALRGLLRTRDRTNPKVNTGEDARPIGTVTQADMLGKHHQVLSKLYGNSDTYAKNTDGSLRLAPDGRPVLLTESEVRKLQANRYKSIADALGQTPQGSDTLVVAGREINPMRLQPNGLSWEGDYFTDTQLNAIQKSVPSNLITPEQLSNIRRLNDAIKTGEGRRLGVDHNTATKEIRGSGKRKYASQGSKFYELVPYGFGVNKEGGLYFRAFDAGSLDRKLGRWMEAKGTKDQFSVWGNDRRAVEADIYKYLENQRKGVLNSLGLDPDPVRAVQKRNLISDLMGATRGQPAINPSQLSGPAGRDNHFKSFRVDRVNRLTESGGRDLPVDYSKVKANLMPESRPPVDVPGQESLPGERRIVAPEGGSPILGTLEDKVASKAGLPSAPIYLQRGRQDRLPDGTLTGGHGFEHILQKHGPHIEHAGFPDLWDFVQGAVSGYTEAWLQPNGRIRLVGEVNKGLAVIELMPNQSGYSVVTAYPVKKVKGEGTLLWSEGPITQTSGSERTSPTSISPDTSLATTQGAGGGGSGVAAAPNKLAEANAPVNVSPLPPGVAPSAVIRHIEAQATHDMRTYLIAGGAPALLAEQLAAIAWKKAERGARRSGPAPHERAMAMRAAEKLKSLLPEDYEAIRAATLKGGMKGAAEELERRLLVAALRK